MKFDVDSRTYTYSPISRDEMVKLSDEYYSGKDDFLGKKNSIPLTELQKEKLSKYCFDREYSLKSTSEIKDLGSYKSGSAHKTEDLDIQEILKIIEQHTYPYGAPIQRSWCKWYGKNSFIGLHTDPFTNSQGKTAYVSSILVYKTDDLEGGEIIISGDLVENVTTGTKVFWDGLMKKLHILKLEEIGDVTTWDNKTLHGVCDIKSGERITLMVVKVDEENT